jgi:hypothetical protein
LQASLSSHIIVDIEELNNGAGGGIQHFAFGVSRDEVQLEIPVAFVNLFGDLRVGGLG